MLKMYGIANCDSVKKAAKWLKDNKVDYIFHDFRKEGIDKKIIKSWLKVVDKDVVINKQSTTWRGLSEEEKALAENKTSSVDLIFRFPALVKRPVMDKDGEIIIGFKDDKYQELFINKQKLKK